MPNDDPDFPPDPPAGKCGPEHENAINRYFDMKRAETEAIDAAKAAKNAALGAAAACAAGIVAGPLGFAACATATSGVIAALEVARNKNDLFGIAIQQFGQSEQTYLDCTSNAEIVIEN